jgi:hypothetical protein
MQVVVTSSHNVDLGHLYLGRLGEQRPIAGTHLMLDITGLEPWAEGDTLSLTSIGATLYGAMQGQPPISPGATSISGYDVDYTQVGYDGNIIDGSAGDKAFVTQTSSRSFDGGTYETITKVLSPENFSMANGQSTTLSGALADVSQDQHLAGSWQRSAFRAQMQTVSAGQLPPTDVFEVYADPGGSERTSGYEPQVSWVSGAGSGDVNVSIDYGNPFPVDWKPMVFASVDYTVSYDTPAGQLSGFGWVGVALPAASQMGTITPGIGPVQNVRVGGQDPAGGLTGVGLTPMLSWSAPALGHPTAYDVSVFGIVDTQEQGLATLTTTQTSVRIPPGILRSGSPYLFVINATTGVDIARPNRLSYPNANATFVTGVVTP